MKARGTVMLYVLGVATSLSIVVVAVLGLVGHAGASVARYEVDSRAETAMNAMVSRMRVSLLASVGALPVKLSATIDGFDVKGVASDNSANLANSIKIDVSAGRGNRMWTRTSYVGKSGSGSGAGGSAARTAGGGVMTYLQPIASWTAPYQYKSFARLARLDPQVNYNGMGSNFVTNEPEGWYAESSGWLNPPATGTYTFRILCDDSCRLWVNGQLLIDYWGQSSATYRTGKAIDLTLNTPVPIRLEYVDFGGGAVDVLEWSYPGQAYQTVPGSALTPAGLLPGTTKAYQFAVDPTSSFLRTSLSSGVSMPLCIDLWSLGYTAGRTITLTACGGWNFQAGSGAGNDTAGLIGCFASTPEINSSTGVQARIVNPVSYGSGNDFVPWWKASDIAQDFWIGTSGARYSSYTVQIPANGRYLFVGIPDVSTGDDGPASDGSVPVLKIQ